MVQSVFKTPEFTNYINNTSTAVLNSKNFLHEILQTFPKELPNQKLMRKSTNALYGLFRDILHKVLKKTLSVLEDLDNIGELLRRERIAQSGDPKSKSEGVIQKRLLVSLKEGLEFLNTAQPELLRQWDNVHKAYQKRYKPGARAAATEYPQEPQGEEEDEPQEVEVPQEPEEPQYWEDLQAWEEARELQRLQEEQRPKEREQPREREEKREWGGYFKLHYSENKHNPLIVQLELPDVDLADQP